jgi:hypothetical protein
MDKWFFLLSSLPNGSRRHPANNFPIPYISRNNRARAYDCSLSYATNSGENYRKCAYRLSALTSKMRAFTKKENKEQIYP